MKETKCDGCGKREDADISMKQREIHPVRLTVVIDDRELHGAQAEQAQSDLCATCIGIIQHMYFGKPAEGTLEVPDLWNRPSLNEHGRRSDDVSCDYLSLCTLYRSVACLHGGLLMGEKIERIEVTFQILKVRTVITRDKEWTEIDVKVTDQLGTRQTTVREGDVLKAEFDAKLEKE